jgi:hypothetical protein
VFAGEADNVVSSFWPNPFPNGKLFGRAISEVDDDAVEENGITAYPKLNNVKDAIAPGDLDPVMIPSAVNLCIPQEIPNLPTRMQGNGAGKTQKTG